MWLVPKMMSISTACGKVQPYRLRIANDRISYHGHKVVGGSEYGALAQSSVRWGCPKSDFSLAKWGFLGRQMAIGFLGPT